MFLIYTFKVHCTDNASEVMFNLCLCSMLAMSLLSTFANAKYAQHVFVFVEWPQVMTDALNELLLVI